MAFEQGSVQHRAISLMQRGQLPAAVAVLEAAQATGSMTLEEDALLCLLYHQVGNPEGALAVIERRLTTDLSGAARSTWLLRQGLTLRELNRRQDCARSLMQVMALHANEEHVRSAQRLLWEIAQPHTKGRPQ